MLEIAGGIVLAVLLLSLLGVGLALLISHWSIFKTALLLAVSAGLVWWVVARFGFQQLLELAIGSAVCVGMVGAPFWLYERWASKRNRPPT